METSSNPSAPVLAQALDLQLQLNAQTRHRPAVMLLCNELAFHFKSTRGSLGWIRHEAVRLAATSNTNKFDERLEAVRDLEAAMQECADQDAEIVFPATGGSLINRAHSDYAHRHGTRNILSLPVRLDGTVCGTFILERQDPPFTPAEVDALRLILDLAARRLDDLDRHGRSWWRAREAKAHEWLVQFLGPERTWLKFGAVAGGVLAVFLFLVPLPYSVGGDFTLKTATLLNLPAPYEGYLREVSVLPGDKVRKGDALFALDNTELLLQQAESAANLQRNRSEAQLAQGQANIGEVHIKLAQANQLDARLRQVQGQIGRAVVQAPFDAVVVEGELRDKIGAPVQKAEVLMKICRFEDMYVEVAVPERLIQDVYEGKKGAIRFASRPGDSFALRVERIEPSPVTGEKGNHFHVRCRLVDVPADWFRPGMTGRARLSSGWRPAWFQITDRLVDFLRLKLWF